MIATSRRVRAGLRFGGLLLAVSALLWWVSTSSVSPEQRIADATGPPPPVIDAALEERTLEDLVVFRGSVVAVDAQPVAAPDVGEASPVVIDVPVAAGDVLDPGEVVAVVADRPVIVVRMPVPLYRSLGPTDTGPDVGRLQAALGDLGYGMADAELDTARFGPSTGAAIEELYADRGYTAASTGPEADEALAAAKAQRRDATTSLEDAEAALAQQRRTLERARKAARDGEQPTATSTETSSDNEISAGGDSDVGDEVSGGGEEAVADAEAAVAAARRVVDQARLQVTDAEAAERATSAAVGVRVPAGELVAVADFPAVVSTVDVTVGQIADETSLVTIAAAQLRIEASVDSAIASLLTPGTEATVDDGWVVQVTTNQGRDDDGRPVVVLEPDEVPSPDALGRDVRVEARLDGTDGPVLAAPITAVRSDIDGDYLRVVGDDGTLSRVGVSTGVSLGGWAEIIASDDDLAAGTTVRLGT